jgi:hypothetical protein
MGKQLVLIDEFDESDYQGEITDDDYGFVIGADGKLKSVFLPDHVPFKTPKNINKILKLFGIHDITNVDADQTLH